MIKEIVLAVTLGALLGFGVTGGYLASQKGHQKSTIIPTPTIIADISPSITNPIFPTSQPETQTNTQSSLTIISPKNEDIVANSLLEIKGSSTPNSIVIVNTNLKQYQTVTNNDGDFSIEIELETGSNNIQIDSFDASDVQSTANFQVTYSTAKI